MTNYIPIIATDFIDAKGIRVTIVHAIKPGSGKAYAEARFENSKLLSCLVCLGADRKKFQRDATQLVENSIPETFRQHTKNMKSTQPTKLPANHNQTLDLIESLIDKHGLSYVVNTIAEVCSAKADHIESNWQDAPLANEWNRAASILLTACEGVHVS